MTLSTEAYDNFLDFCESHGIELRQDETARATLRAMHDQLEDYARVHKAACGLNR